MKSTRWWIRHATEIAIAIVVGIVLTIIVWEGGRKIWHRVKRVDASIPAPAVPGTFGLKPGTWGVRGEVRYEVYTDQESRIRDARKVLGLDDPSTLILVVRWSKKINPSEQRFADMIAEVNELDGVWKASFVHEQALVIVRLQSRTELNPWEEIWKGAEPILGREIGRVP